MISTSTNSGAAEIVTPAGYRELQHELAEIRSVDHPAAQRQLHEARADGGLADNVHLAEAIDHLARVEHRIATLTQHLVHCRVVIVESIERAEIGTNVVVRDLTAQVTMSFTLVGPLEADPELGYITTESPIGAAIHGLQIGETGIAKTPRGDRPMRLESIAIPTPPPTPRDGGTPREVTTESLS